ncbi:MAG: dihydropteroate synthase [Thermodesulfovibrionales bacterium]|jgi:cobalamin-dependent methionine synthase I
MIVIAENLNIRNKPYIEAVRKRDKKTIAMMAKELADAGAQLINVQCSLDGVGDEAVLPLAVEAVRDSTEAGISLDSRNLGAIKACLPICKKPPLINFISATEPDHGEELLALVAKSMSSLILRASKGTVPTTLEAKLQIIEELIERANEADIPNERLFGDPSLVHIGRGMGQDHIVNSHECVRALNAMVDPPMNTIAWISNISVGLPKGLRSRVNASFLYYLAGAGLDAAYVNVLDPEIQRAVYLIKSFRDELIFTPADLSK